MNKAKAYNAALIFLAGMSLWFYGYFNPYYLVIIVASILVNYLISFLLQYCKSKKSNLLGLLFGVFFNLGILFYYKYYDFFIDNINALFKLDFALKHILLPLGISFFTFQQLSFIIDRYKGKAKHYEFIKYITFVTFFPQLVAGPIVLYDEMMPQFENIEKRKFNPENFVKGLCLFSLGLGKKVLLADTLAGIANFGFDSCIFLDSVSTFVVGLVYAFELYFDFSGYSDMAIGLGRMINIELPQNFNSPYKACSMKQLWQGWHITLSRFFIQYVYIPMGGSRKGKGRALFNVFFIFMLSGLWHGAAWTYIAWGVIQGLALVWDNLYIVGVKGEDKKREPKIGIPKLLGQFITFNFFLGTLYVFRANSLSDAGLMLKNLFSFKYTGSISRLLPYADIPEIYIFKQVLSMTRPGLTDMLFMVTILVLLAISIFIITRKNTLQIVDGEGFGTAVVFWSAIVLVLSVISFSQVSTFIYFNF